MLRYLPKLEGHSKHFVLTKATSTTKKTSLENKYLRLNDCFAAIVSCSHSKLFAKYYNWTGVCASEEENTESLKDLPLYAQIAVKTENAVISRSFCRGRHGIVATEVRAARAARLFLIIRPIKFPICGVVVAVPAWSMLKLPNRELSQ